MQISTLFVVANEPAVLNALSDLCKQAQMNSEIFTTTEAFLAEFDPERPGCLLLDLSLPGTDWGNFHRTILRRQSITPVIILTNPNDARSAMEMLKGGALDFFEKPFDSGALLEAIRQAIDMDIANRHVLRFRNEGRQRFAQLTRREREIMCSMCEGKSSREIAAQLNMSARTVESHRAMIKRKTDVATPVELVRMVTMVFGCHCIHKHGPRVPDVQLYSSLPEGVADEPDGNVA